MYRVFQQSSNRHRADTAGNGRNHGSAFFGDIKLHIAAQAAVVQAVDAHIDNDCAGFDPFAFNEIRNAYADHQNICGSNFIGKVLRGAVADGYRRAGQQ